MAGECLGDDPLRRAAQPDIGDSGKPIVELGVQIIEIAEDPGQEGVLADGAERQTAAPPCLSFKPLVLAR